MNAIKELILDCLIEVDESLTQIVEYLALDNVDVPSREEVEEILSDMVLGGYIRVNHTWKNEHNENPYSLTEKGRSAWHKLNDTLK